MDAAPDLRASDAERERVVATLRRHAAEGRLTVEELADRTGRAYAALTRRELAALVEDLPSEHAGAGGADRTGRRRRLPGREQAGAYLAVMALLVTIWALTGMGYFWPLWPALGWGIALLPGARARHGAWCAPRRRSRPA